MQILLGVAITLVVLYVGVCIAIFFFQRSLIYFPTQTDAGADKRTTTLHVPGAELKVSTRMLDSDNALLYFGGNAEDASAKLPILSGAFPNHSLYLLHYRGYSGSTGTPSEEFLIADALALFDKVHSDHKNVVVIGRSLGSGVAIHLASVRPVARLVLVSPFDSLVDIAAKKFPYFPIRWLLRDKFESWCYAPKVSAPTVILSVEDDEIVPRESTMRLLSRFPKGIAVLTGITGVSHNKIWDSPAYVPALIDGVPSK
ncbi:MAG: alpha/beta fold hydrolase [Gammaproteobacteria bacterium]|nr:alpha/beta fold hydrolase [Gammaproteobacteria bacterium]